MYQNFRAARALSDRAKGAFSVRAGFRRRGRKECPLTMCVCMSVRLRDFFVLKYLADTTVEIAKNEDS